MEGFFESFIYLLITIVILVLSLRKRKPVQPESDETTQADDSFSEIFKDEQEEEFDAGLQHETVTEERERKSKESTPWMSKTEAEDMLMDADAVIKEAAENNIIAQYEGQLEEDAYGIGMTENKGISFDLKRAVIYSEILERRVF